jgi:hypothetical protein
MTIRGGYAHTGQAGSVAQGKTLHPMFFNQQKRGPHQG